MPLLVQWENNWKFIDSPKFNYWIDVLFGYYAAIHSLPFYLLNSLAAVESVWKSGKICVLDIDMQGVKQVKQRSNMMDPILVFIKPPSLKELEDRLRKRGTETEDSLQRRLAVAQEEIEYGEL